MLTIRNSAFTGTSSTKSWPIFLKDYKFSYRRGHFQLHYNLILALSVFKREKWYIASAFPDYPGMTMEKSSRALLRMLLWAPIKNHPHLALLSKYTVSTFYFQVTGWN